MFLLTKVHSHLYEDRSLFFNHIYEDFLKWFMGTLVFSTLSFRDFSFFLFSIFYFLFSFLRVNKKDKNANKWISYFSPLRCFYAHFLFLFVYLRFVLLLGCFFVLFSAFGAFRCFWNFWCFLVRAKSFRKKTKEFKTALITFVLLITIISFILLLS